MSTHRIGMCRSVKLELSKMGLATRHALLGVATRFMDDEVGQHQRIHICRREATISVLRCTHNRFAANIETGIHQNGTIGELMKFAEQPVQSGIAPLVYRLDAGAVVYVRYRRHNRSDDVNPMPQ